MIARGGVKLLRGAPPLRNSKRAIVGSCGPDVLDRDASLRDGNHLAREFHRAVRVRARGPQRRLVLYDLRSLCRDCAGERTYDGSRGDRADARALARAARNWPRTAIAHRPRRNFVSCRGAGRPRAWLRVSSSHRARDQANAGWSGGPCVDDLHLRVGLEFDGGTVSVRRDCALSWVRSDVNHGRTAPPQWG